MRRFIILVCAAALALAGGAPTLAIEGGVADNGGHPNVGVLAFDVDGPGGIPPFASCSGSVIADDAFLTAAHCIIPPLFELPPNVTWAVSLEPGSPTSPIIPGGYFPADVPYCCVLTVPESAISYSTNVVVDPLYDPNSFGLTGGAHDLAVVEFAPGTFAGVDPVDIVRAGQLEHLAAAGNRQGPQVTMVGYGGELRDGAVYFAGYRKTARASFIDLTDVWVALTQTTDSLPRNAAACLGDSGSPQFLGGSNIEIAVFHDGALGCDGIGYAQRLDTPAEQAFLAPYLASQ
jgi:hypothetical protein